MSKVRVAVRADGVMLPYHASLENTPGVSIQDVDFSDPQHPKVLGSPQLSRTPEPPVASAGPQEGGTPITDVGQFADDDAAAPAAAEAPEAVTEEAPAGASPLQVAEQLVGQGIPAEPEDGDGAEPVSSLLSGVLDDATEH